SVYRATSELYLDTICILGVRLKLEHSHSALFLAKSGSTHIQHVGKPLKVDSAIDAEIGTHAGSRAFELHVYGDGAILHRWINAHHLAVDNPVVRVDLSGKTDRDVLGLGLGNLELC